MWIKEILVPFCSILVLKSSTVSVSSSSDGWKPIAPPSEYYVTASTPCASTDCDLKLKYPLLDNAGGGGGGVGEGEAETQLKSTLLTKSLNFNQNKDFQVNQKLDFQVFKPAELSFLKKDQENAYSSQVPTYEDILRKTPTSFFSFKTFGGGQKPTKTIYYGDLEVSKPKYYKTYGPTLGNEVKLLKSSSSFLDNEVKQYRPSSKPSIYSDHCSLYKVSFRQDLYYQFIQYKVHMPELKEFTICLWARFHNHSHDHSLFSYAGKPHQKAIYMWVSNLNDPALFNMKVMGQTIFRLNYPIHLYKWYHTCQSWNGNTGEWQVWVNAHRIGRGFHNLLVGHHIPGGGLAISGQEHRHFGKGFQEIPHYLKGSGGLEGEITMLQMYKVALTAGKAYNDHRHHHSHYTSTTPEPPELPTEEPSTTTDHPFLENGQLKKHINVLELAEALRTKKLELPEKHSEYDYFHHHLSHPYTGHVSPLAVHGNAVNFVGLPNHVIFKRNDESTEQSQVGTAVLDQGAQEQRIIPEKIKFVANVSDSVHVEKIKYSTAKDNEEIVASPYGSVDEGSDNATTLLVENLTEPYTEEIQSEEQTRSGSRVGRARLKRQNPRSSIRVLTNRPKRVTTTKTTDSKSLMYPIYRLRKRGDGVKFGEKGATKRHIIFGDPFLGYGPVGSLDLLEHDGHSSFTGLQTPGFNNGYFQQFGQEDLGGSSNEQEDDQNHDDPPKFEPELAEGEVRRVIAMCSGCHTDPFRKVALISWRSTPKKIYSGALFLKAKPECENF